MSPPGRSGGVPGFLEIREALSLRTVHTALLGLGGWHRDRSWGAGQLAQRALSSEKALNRLNESLVSEIQKRGIAIPSLYAIGGKSCVRVCNLNQRSQRSDFEALVQACEQLGVELEARTGHKAVQHVKIRRVAALR